jgi:hypothetical protein
MNERIRELLKQATKEVDPHDRVWVFSKVDQAKFAELIVRECVELNKQELAFNAFERLLNRYKEHFGVEE